MDAITPEAAPSTHCAQANDYARELSKPIVLVQRVPIDDDRLPAKIRDRNWISPDGHFDLSLERSLAVYDLDLGPAKTHTRWLLKALEWHREGGVMPASLRGTRQQERHHLPTREQAAINGA